MTTSFGTLLPGRRSPSGLSAAQPATAHLASAHLDDAGFAMGAPRPDHGLSRRLDRHHGLVVAVELITGLVLVAVSAVGIDAAVRGATGATFHAWGVAGLLGAESVSLAALAVMPQWLLRSQRVRLSGRDAVRIGLASNAIAVFVPAGAVSSSLWSGRQYRRRGAPAAVAMWTVLVGGFASTTTLLFLLSVGAGIAGLLSPALTAAAVIGVVAASTGTQAIVHRVPGPGQAHLHLPASALTAVVTSLAVRAAAIGHLRAGWRRGGGALGAAALNWLADAAALAAAFLALGVPTPWAGILFAYCAAQAASTVIPIPGGIGVLEGGLFGGLVLAGAAPHQVIAVIALYRIVGYWLPAALGLPAYWSARHHDKAASLLDDDPLGPFPRPMSRR
jgi:uncharacterized membrane protein YbhN (UPF0104 family)